MKPRYKPYRHSSREDNPMKSVNVHMPVKTYEFIKALSEARDLPISRLICFAVDNEMDCDPAFNFETTIPNVEYKEFQYAEEAAKILKYLMAYFQKSGTGLDTLLLCRRDIGIESKERFLLGFRELLEKKMLESFYPQYNVKFRYAKDYRYYRPALDVVVEAKQRKNSAIKKINSTLEKGPLDEIKDDFKEKN